MGLTPLIHQQKLVICGKKNKKNGFIYLFFKSYSLIWFFFFTHKNRTTKLNRYSLIKNEFLKKHGKIEIFIFVFQYFLKSEVVIKSID